MFRFQTKVKDNFMSHIDPSIQKLIGDGDEYKIDLDTYKNVFLNSYEQKYIEPCLSDQALVWKIENAIKNSKRLGIYELPRHYDEYLSTDGINELLKRFKDKINVQ